MFDAWQMILVIAVLLGFVFSGIHIAVALGITSALGIYLMTGVPGPGKTGGCPGRPGPRTAASSAARASS